MNCFKKYAFSIYFSVIISFGFLNANAKSLIVLMTDFGSTDGAVSTMKGVIYTIDQSLTIADLSHNIESFNIFEASYRLYQVIQYYPKGSIFVAVVDPGVGTSRKSIVAKTKNGYYIVTPDNGTLTHIAAKYGIDEIREIDEKQNRLPNSKESHTFYGRDVFAYTGAKLASEKISFEGVGANVLNDYITIPLDLPKIKQNAIQGNIIALDGDYGNLWTNINAELIKKYGASIGDEIQIEIYNNNKLVYKSKVKYRNTFGDVKVGMPVAYLNSLGNFAVAINQGNFAKKHNISSGFRLNVKKMK